MSDHLFQFVSAPAFGLSWLAGMLLLLELGRRAGYRRLAVDPEHGMAGNEVTTGAVYTVFGLLVAFTFSSGAARLDARRQLIVEEANAIGTAYLRLDLLTADARPALRQMFRDYVDVRLATYDKLPDIEAATAELNRSQALQRAIWTRVIATTRDAGSHPDAAKLLLPALNSMIDITTTRTAITRMHPPAIIYALLYIVGLGCALLAGYRAAQSRYRDWITSLGFVIVMGVSIFVILSVEFPRMGFNRLQNYDQLLVDARASMEPRSE